jgi:hypothetical protein
LVVFSSRSTQTHGKIVVPDSLTPKETLFNNDDSDGNRIFIERVGYSAADLHTEIFNGTLRSLTKEDCVARYDVGLNYDGSTVVLVTPKTELFHSHTVSLVPSYDPCPENEWHAGYLWI